MEAMDDYTFDSESQVLKAIKKNNVLAGHKWYHKLDQAMEDGKRGYVLSLEYRTGCTSRIFSYFDTWREVYEYVKEFSPQVSHFYEVINGEDLSKMRFDVDFKIDSPTEGKCNALKKYREYRSELLSSLLIALMKTFPHIVKGGRINGLLISESLRDDAVIPEKISFHVILLHYVGVNKALVDIYKRVLENIDPKYAKYIDSKVYSSRQNFRLLGSSKIGKLYYKKLLPYFSFPYKKKNIIYTCDHEGLELFRGFLCSYFDDKATIVPPPPEPELHFTSEQHDYDLCEIEKALEKIGEFKIVKELEDKNIILLGNIAGYNCPICNSEHESENPYLIIKTSGVYFDCRRKEEHKKNRDENIMRYPLITYHRGMEDLEKKLLSTEEDEAAVIGNVSRSYVRSQRQLRNREEQKSINKESNVSNSIPKHRDRILHEILCQTHSTL